MFENQVIPEPPTLRDTYDTRTDALHENQQRVFSDLTRRDLKLAPPPGIEGDDLQQWLSTKPDVVVVARGARADTLEGERLGPVEVPALHAGLSCDDSVY